MSGIDYRLLRARVSIRCVLDLIKYRPTRIRGAQWRGPCPLRQHPSSPHDTCFSINTDRSIYRCFRCGSQGNQLDLWMAITNQPIHPAALDLCRRLNAPLSRLEKRNSKPTPWRTTPPRTTGPS